MLHIENFEPRFIRQYSDIFIGEGQKFFPPKEPTDPLSLLILAGNVFDPLKNVNNFEEEVEKFLEHCSINFPQTIIVPGYLEVFGAQYEHEIFAAMQCRLNDRFGNIHIVSNEIIQFGKTLRLVCSPLLTDFNGFKEVASDFEINFSTPFSLSTVIAQNSNSKDYIYKNALKVALEKEHDGIKTGLITHTSPSSKFASLSRFDDKIENVTSYCSMDYVIKSAVFDFYIWGNTNQTLMQRSKIRNKDVLFATNSLGNKEQQNPEFDLSSLIDISIIRV